MTTITELKSKLDFNGTDFVWKYTRGRAKQGAVAGFKNKNGYRQIGINGKQYYIHRLVWLWHHGEFPTHEIDHISGDITDNRIENLRTVTHQENGCNTKLRNDNTSGHQGVSWCKITSKWFAYIWQDGKRADLGRYIELDDAIEVRQVAEIEYGFHANHGRAAA